MRRFPLLIPLFLCLLLSSTLSAQQRLDAFDPVLSINDWAFGGSLSVQHLGLNYTGPAVSNYGEIRQEFEFKPEGAGNNFELGFTVQRRNSQLFGWESGLWIGSSANQFDFEQNVFDPLRGRRESNFKYDLRHHRLKLPFLFQLHLANSPRVLLEAGVFGAYNFATTGDITVETSFWEETSAPTWVETENFEPTDHTLLGTPNQFDWGVMAGIGLDFPIDYYQSVGLGLRFEKSLEPLYEPYEITAYRVGITASYRFLP